jgi:reactive chlorine resistance protein C
MELRSPSWQKIMITEVEERIPNTAKAHGLRKIYAKAASLDRIGLQLLRLGLVVVLVWIGGLKFARYEADSIVPLVANSPVMSFFYNHPAPEYRPYMNREGEVIPAHRDWHETNGTYPLAYGLGVVIVSIGILIALNPVLPQVAAVGSFLLILMSLTTLSFLITTPEAWVPALGDSAHGFPFLSGTGRLVIKDAIMLGAAVTTMADSAKTYLRFGAGREVTDARIAPAQPTPDTQAA